MMRPLVCLLAALLAHAAAAQPASAPQILDSALMAVDSTSTSFGRADSLAMLAAAARDSAGVALDSLLAAHEDVLARHVDEVEASRPWWRRWWALPAALGLVALAGLVTGIAAFVRAARVDREMALQPTDGGPAARAATQSAARADAAVAALSASVSARLADVERTRTAVEAQIAQTANLLERAERLGLFRDAFASAMAATPPPADGPDAPSTPEPPAA